MNEYDSDKMADILRACDGMTQTETPDDADVILLNTCSIREKAEGKVFSDLGRVRAIKQARPHGG
jgi:tRNA-2-methylthio-N6-dimethylallyladenosine synthase